MGIAASKNLITWVVIFSTGLSSCFKSKLETKVASGSATNCDAASSSKSASCAFKVSVNQSNNAGTAATITWSKPDKATGDVTYKAYKSTDKTLTSSEQLSSKATLIGDATTSTSAAAASLTPATTMYFYVVATDSKGKVFLSDPVEWQGVPGLPTPGGSGTLTIPGGSITTTSMTIQWAEATAADGTNNVTYDVYQSTSNNITTLASTLANGTRLTNPSLPAGTTSYTATGLLPTTTYYFTVVVTDAYGTQSIYTSTSGTTSPDTTAPTAGGGGTITYSGPGATGFTANWTAATDDINTAAQLQYRVYYSTTNNITNATDAQTNGTAANAWTTNIATLGITGLSPSTTYFVQVLVRDTTGNIAAYTSSSQATTADATPPTVGNTTLSYSSATDSGFTVSWNAATDNVTPAASLQYIVYTSTSNNIATPATAAANGTAANAYTTNITTLNVTGLSASTSYYVQVLVRDAAGNVSAYASTQTTTAADSTSPVAGGGGTITYSGVGATGFTANWTAATDNTTAQASLQYRVYYSASNNITTAADAVANGTAANAYTTNIASLAITGLSPSTTYYTQVLVRDAAGNVGVYTSSSQATTADATPPTVGNTTLSYSSATDNGFTVSWNAATDNVTPAASLQYIVYTSTSNNIATPATAAANGTAANAYTTNITTLNVTGLSASTSYYVQVLVRDAAGNVSAYASTQTTTAADSTLPVAGGGGTITYSGVGATGFTANWTAATDNTTAQASLQYRVYYSTSNNITNAADAQTNGTAASGWVTNITTFGITAQSPSTTYYVQILVRDAAGNIGAYTSSSQATTADTTAPTVGGAGTITYSGVTSSQITANWTGATDNVTAAASLQYRVYYSTSNNITNATDAVTNGTAANAYTANITSLNVTGLTASTTYYFQVLVRDAAGNISNYASSSQATSASGGAGTSTGTNRAIFTAQTPLDGLAMGSSGASPAISVTSTYGADTQCAADGALGGAPVLPNSKWNWNALVGINGYSIRNRFNLPNVTFETPLPATIATTETQLFTQNLSTPVSVAYDGIAQPGWGTAWTGKASNWTSAEAGGASGVSCGDWSQNSMSDTGSHGDGNDNTATKWLGGGNQSNTCNNANHFYCINTPPAYIFITSTTQRGNFGESGADTLCQNLGSGGTASSALGVQKWRAVIARNSPYTGMDPRQGLSLPHNTQVYLVDGTTKVANTSSQLFNDGGGVTLAGITLDENGVSVATSTVWTGDGTTNCLNWTSQNGSDQGKAGAGQFTDNRWWANTPSACNAMNRLYCIGQ